MTRPSLLFAADETGGGAGAVFDPAALADLRRRGARNPALLRAIVTAFLDEGPARLAAMRTAAAAGDAAQLRTAAHALKGAAAAVGARWLADLCAELEKVGRAGGVEGVNPLLAQLEPQLRQVCEALQAESPRPT